VHSRKYLLWRWSLQDHRRRQELDSHRTERYAAYSARLVDPRNPDHVLIAALGHAYGPNPDRGVFRTTDGGNTWEKLLYKDEKTGAIDLAVDSAQSERDVCSAVPGAAHAVEFGERRAGERLVQIVRRGNSWKRLEGKGLPAGIMGRIGVSVSGADSNRVYALIEAKDSGLYRSDDGGESWARVNDDQRLTQRAWYFTHIFADPKSADTVYMLNTGAFRSTDGGKTLGLLPAPHGDHHGFWIDPQNPNRMINGNDGGASISVDGGKSWSTEYNQPTAQFYHVSADNEFLYNVYGAQQDNSTVGIASRTDEGYIGRQHWFDAGAAKAATSRPIRGTPTSFMQARVRPDDPTGPSPQPVAGHYRVAHGKFGTRCRRPEVPAGMDAADPDLGARSQCDLHDCRARVQDHKPGAELAGNQSPI